MQRRTRLSLCAVAMLALVGCTQLDDLQRYKNQVDGEIAATRAEIDRTRASLATRPNADPKVAQILDEASKALNVASERSKDLQTVIDGIRNQDPAGALAPLRKIPGVGQYADLAILLATIGWGIWQRQKGSQAAKAAGEAVGHLKSVVLSVEKALPDRSEAAKTSMANIQGAETTAAVQAIKDELGL